MTNITLVENKISVVQKYLKILQLYRKYSCSQLEGDITLRGATERYLYLVTQATIDLAEAIIALKGFRKPGTYSEAFSILAEEKFIGIPLQEKLIKMTGFRNIIAHDYQKLDFDIVYDVLLNGSVDIKKFLQQIQKKLRLRQ